MDFIIIPSSRASFGLPQVKGRSWFGVLVIIQLVYFVLYHFVSQDEIRLLSDPFGCGFSSECLTSHFVVVVDWFIASVSIVLPMIMSELLFDESVYFSYHYIYFIRLFLPYRFVALAALLPVRRMPVWFAIAAAAVHLGAIVLMVRIFYVLLKEIDKARSSLIAIQLSFKHLVHVTLVKVYRSLDGEAHTISPSICSLSRSAEVCPICFDPLSISTNRTVTSVSRSRANASIHRPLMHGKLDIFTTSCNHAFHRDCLMRWISGKPIKVALGADQESFNTDNRRSGASCPVCGRGIRLKIKRSYRYLLEFVWNRRL